MSEIKSLTCTKHGGKPISISNFYRAPSKSIYSGIGYVAVCKECIDKYYEEYVKKYKDEEEAIYYLCMLLDLPFSHGDYEGAVQHSSKTGWKLYQSFFKQLNSFGEVNSSGTCFTDSEILHRHRVSDGSEITDNVNSSSDNEDLEITQDIVLFWGKGFKNHEYSYLENFYTDFVNSYECDSPAQVLLFKNAAKTQLNADKALAEENVNLYDKLMKTLSTILGDSNIKPVQETGANATEQATFGTLIKKWENDKPIPDPLEEWKLSNWIRYIRIWFFSHLAKMTGNSNPYEEEYQTEMNKFRVEVPFEESEDVN